MELNLEQLIDPTLVILAGATKNSDINIIENFVDCIMEDNPGYTYVQKKVETRLDFLTLSDVYVAHYYITPNSNVKI